MTIRRGLLGSINPGNLNKLIATWVAPSPNHSEIYQSPSTNIIHSLDIPASNEDVTNIAVAPGGHYKVAPKVSNSSLTHFVVKQAVFTVLLNLFTAWSKKIIRVRMFSSYLHDNTEGGEFFFSRLVFILWRLKCMNN